MRVIPRVPVRNIDGLADKVLGLGKELAGELFDEQRLIDAGTAQQGKGTEKLQAIRERAKAESHRDKARQLEEEQRHQQASKVG